MQTWYRWCWWRCLNKFVFKLLMLHTAFQKHWLWDHAFVAPGTALLSPVCLSWEVAVEDWIFYLANLYVLSMLWNPSNGTCLLFVWQKQQKMIKGGKRNCGECVFKLALQWFNAMQAATGLWIKACCLCRRISVRSWLVIYLPVSASTSRNMSTTEIAILGVGIRGLIQIMSWDPQRPARL